MMKTIGTFKEFGYTYNHSWLLFDEDELADLIDEYEIIIDELQQKLNMAGAKESIGAEKE